MPDQTTKHKIKDDFIKEVCEVTYNNSICSRSLDKIHKCATMSIWNMLKGMKHVKK